MKSNHKFILFAVLFITCGFADSDASPPACFRNDVSMYIYSDVVVESVVKHSRRWSEGTSTRHLVAQYVVTDFLENIKGLF
jgi:hypothetical protein